MTHNQTREPAYYRQIMETVSMMESQKSLQEINHRIEELTQQRASVMTQSEQHQKDAIANVKDDALALKHTMKMVQCLKKANKITDQILRLYQDRHQAEKKSQS